MGGPGFPSWLELVGVSHTWVPGEVETTRTFEPFGLEALSLDRAESREVVLLQYARLAAALGVIGALKE